MGVPVSPCSIFHMWRSAVFNRHPPLAWDPRLSGMAVQNGAPLPGALAACSALHASPDVPSQSNPGSSKQAHTIVSEHWISTAMAIRGYPVKFMLYIARQDMTRRGQYGHIINISSMSGHRVPNGGGRGLLLRGHQARAQGAHRGPAPGGAAGSIAPQTIISRMAMAGAAVSRWSMRRCKVSSQPVVPVPLSGSGNFPRCQCGHSEACRPVQRQSCSLLAFWSL